MQSIFIGQVISTIPSLYVCNKNHSTAKLETTPALMAPAWDLLKETSRLSHKSPVSVEQRFLTVLGVKDTYQMLMKTVGPVPRKIQLI